VSSIYLEAGAATHLEHSRWFDRENDKGKRRIKTLEHCMDKEWLGMRNYNFGLTHPLLPNCFYEDRIVWLCGYFCATVTGEESMYLMSEVMA